MTYIRDELRTLALKFGLNDGESIEFDALWPMRRRASKYARKHDHAGPRAVARAFRAVADVVAGRPTDEPGHQHVEDRPASGRYVVFSDHHLSFTGHRQNFFASSGNLTLYSEALKQYAAAGWTVVENGDVEELVIQEPTPKMAQKLGRAALKKLPGIRRPYRLQLLGRILDDAALTDYYGLLSELSQDGQYVKLLGNHDLDLHDPEFGDRYREKVADAAFFDHLRLVDDTGLPRFVVTHGHQFDKTTTPRVAPKLGECFSEALAWAYEGADRVWRWNDAVADWATGTRGFRNVLSTDKFESNRCAVLDGLGMASGFLDSPEGYEALFGHNVAWEYFESASPSDAIRYEVKTGDEFFKYRHLNEIQTRRSFLDAARSAIGDHLADDALPTLVLGHSHEVRVSPGASEDEPTQVVHNYMNTGAAGRFENLLWALEIDAGEARVVAWSRDRGPRAGKSKRRVCVPGESDGVRVVRARRSPEALR